VAVDAGGPSELIESGRSGLLCPPDPTAIGHAVAQLAGAPDARERLARGGLTAVRDRTWDAALGRLAAGWHRALASHGAERTVRAA
jgi:glycosyltransferase involved in cell wall biosynthesis